MPATIDHRDHAFVLVEFTNEKTGSTSWRVSGSLRGKRIRENFASRKAADARRLQLDMERLGLQTAEVLRATWLTQEQLKTAEAVFTQLPEPAEVKLAMDWWHRHGKDAEAATRHADGMTIDEAFARFEQWLETTPTLRAPTRRNLKYRGRMFVSELGNRRLAEVTPELVEGWLDSRKSSPVTRHNDMRAVGRFFGWCCERKQRFISANPCALVTVEKPESGPPKIYTPREILRILAAGRKFRKGRFLKFIVLGLFAGLRPGEALAHEADHLIDGELTVWAGGSKRKRTRTIKADPVLLAWLKLCPEGPATNPQNSKLLWGQFKAKARLREWIPDGLRHNAVSYYFRRCGSYGLTAEWAGNSESVIKAHYQGRVSEADAAKFWKLFPDRQDRRPKIGGAK